jgi:plasmid maintenance system antidote protein VapI
VTKTKLDQFLSERANARLFEQESLVFDATEMICSLMDERDVSRSALADLLGTSKANISQLLDGSRNMTLRTLADLAFALGQRVQFHLSDADKPQIADDESRSDMFGNDDVKWNWQQRVPGTTLDQPTLIYRQGQALDAEEQKDQAASDKPLLAEMPCGQMVA